MIFFLDTNVVSNLRKERANGGLLAWLARTPDDEVCIPAPVIFEIQFGIERLRLESKVDKADAVEDLLDRMLNSRCGDTVIPLGLNASRLQAKMFADPGLRNFVDPDPRSTKLKFGADLIVAAMAIVHQAVIVSFEADFLKHVHGRYPLPGLFHPRHGEWLVPALTLGSLGK